MAQINVYGKVYSFPESWDEITWRQFQALTNLKKLGLSPLVETLEAVKILTGMPDDDVQLISGDHIKIIIAAYLNFADTPVPIEEYHGFTSKDGRIHSFTTIRQMKQLVDIDTFMVREKIKPDPDFQINVLACVMIWREPNYANPNAPDRSYLSRMAERRELLKDQSVQRINGLSFFLPNILKPISVTTLNSLGVRGLIQTARIRIYLENARRKRRGFWSWLMDSPKYFLSLRLLRLIDQRMKSLATLKLKNQ